MDDLYEWYDTMDERAEASGARDHELGTCGDDCGWCRQEDEYDRHKDDVLDGLR